MKIVHVSASRLETFDTCPYQYRLRYHQELPPAREHPSAQFGSWIHHALEIHLRDGIPLEVALRDSLAQFNVVDTYLDRVPQIMRNFQKINAGLPPGKTEWEFTLDFGVGVPVNGVIDRLIQFEGGVLVLDYKTGTWQKTPSQLKDNYQMKIYAMASHHLTGVPYHRIQLGLLYLLSGEVPKVRFQPPEMDHFQRTLCQKVEEIISTPPEAARARPGRGCHLCGYTHLCGAYRNFKRIRGKD